MTRKRAVARERLSGQGRLLSRSGSELGRVRYDLQFTQEMLRADTLSGSSEIEGLTNGRGTIAVVDAGDAPWNTAEAILELQDGSQIDVLFPQLISPLQQAHRFITSGELRETI